jgi:CxxC-x17-CxxC domain-containing protein
MALVPYDHDHENEVVAFAKTNFRGEPKKFGIKTDDRRRHVYIIGKTGMGKTTLIENMALADIYAGHGICYIDPHGDTADKILDFIPPHRLQDVVYFNPADMDFPVGFNILEIVNENQKHLVASGLMGVFKKIWPDVWSARMEYILLNCVLALLDTPGSTLLGISRILADKEYRKQIVENVKDPIVKAFWVNEFAKYTDKFASEAIAPVQNKVGQFLSNTIIRNIVAQAKSTIDVRDIMDNRKIFIVNLSKGLVGEDSSKLLGGMLITRLQLAAMERVDMAEKDRQDFFLYVDEFQNFATESFANILSEARKYRLCLITAHQYIEQLAEEVAAAVFGNVGTIIAMRVGANDAEHLAKEFAPTFIEEDIINLAKFEIYLKLMIDGVASSPFSATCLPPIGNSTGSRAKAIEISRSRYAVKRADIEDLVNKWSGFSEGALYGAKLGGPGPVASFGKSYGDPERQYEAKCSRCGKDLRLKFPPDPSRPFFCKECLPLAKAEGLTVPPPKPALPPFPTRLPAPPPQPKPVQAVAPAPVKPPPPTPTPKPPQATIRITPAPVLTPPPKPVTIAVSSPPKAPAPPPPQQLKPPQPPRPHHPRPPHQPPKVLPPPPKEGMFGGKIRIVRESEPEKLVEERPKPPDKLPPEPPGAQTLAPGQSIKF